MKYRFQLVILCFMTLFIFIHALYSEFGFFEKTCDSFMPFLAGFSLSITHDSLSTRNPALEAFFAILSDLPGGYSFYFSPILTSVPEIESGNVNGQAVQQWIDVRNPRASSLTALQTQQLIFLLFILLSLIFCFFWIIKHHIHQRKRKKRG